MAEPLLCLKDYGGQKNHNQQQRRENVRGVFSYNGKLEGEHIVIVDDVITTGATVSECAEVCYNSGASKVSIVVLGVSQITNTWRELRETKVLRCEKCDGIMELKFNSRDRFNRAFFGCSNYSKEKCKFTYDYMTGLRKHNEINDISGLEQNESKSKQNIQF